MNNRLIILIIIVVLAVLYPSVSLVQYHMGNQVMVDGMTVSGTGNPNECWYQDDIGEMIPCVIGAGAIDLDPDLSPSYAIDFAMGAFYHTILPLVGLGLGISALFLVPHFILKRKSIPSKPYLSLILAGLLLYFFIPHFVASLHIFTIIFSQPEQFSTSVFNFRFVLLLIPIIVCVISGIILYRSSVIRKLIRK